MSKKTLGLVMIVKNEEKGLEKAILSAKPFVNFIKIVIDDKTSDKTFQIAQKYADKIEYFTFQDNFAAARNFAHRDCPTDWILFLDGHEYIKECHNLEKYLDSPVDGILTAIEMENGAVFRNPRIYKKGVEFVGAVHERQNCQKTIPAPDIIIKHNRILGQNQWAIDERDKQRNDQVPRIMGSEIEENPKNTRASFHLALHAQAQNKNKEALKYQKLYLKYSQVAPERWFVLFNRSLILLSLGKLWRAFWATCQAEKETPKRWEIAFVRGLIFFEDRNYKKALDFFIESLDSNTGDVTYKPLPQNYCKRWNYIGECFCFLGQYDKAYEAFIQAAQNTEEKGFRDFLKRRACLMQDMFKR